MSRGFSVCVRKYVPLPVRRLKGGGFGYRYPHDPSSSVNSSRGLSLWSRSKHECPGESSLHAVHIVSRSSRHVAIYALKTSQRNPLGAVTQHPTEAWIEQMARIATDEDGRLWPVRYVLHDRDTKFCGTFDFAAEGRRRGGNEIIGAVSQLERICRTVGAIGQAGVLIQADPLRRGLAETLSDRIHCALPFRAAAPGEGKYIAVSTPCSTPRAPGHLQRKAWRACSNTTPEQHEYFDGTGTEAAADFVVDDAHFEPWLQKAQPKSDFQGFDILFHGRSLAGAAPRADVISIHVQR
jgi:hypothetical protein